MRYTMARRAYGVTGHRLEQVMRLTPHHVDRSMPERKADARADVQLIRQTLARVLQLVLQERFHPNGARLVRLALADAAVEADLRGAVAGGVQQIDAGAH